jgi:hypothetical protein
MLEKKIEIKIGAGNETHFGIPVCRGPKTYRLLITWPYKLVGEIVEVPVEEVSSISDIESGKMGSEPAVVGEVPT